MTGGGLLTCPKCKQPLHEIYSVHGVCTLCGFEIGRMDPDALADEIERQQDEEQRMGCSPGVRALGVASITSLSLSLLMIFVHPGGFGSFFSPSAFNRLVFRVLLPCGIIGSLTIGGAYVAALRARRQKLSSGHAWALSFFVGLAPLILFVAIMLLLGLMLG